MRLWLATLASTVLGMGCSSDAFVCMADIQCGSEGRCEAVGVCSFPDEECASGRRYADSAGHLSGQCVEEETSTGTDTGPTSTSPATDASATASTSGPGTSPLDTGSDGSDSSPPLEETATTDPPECDDGWWDCAWAARLPLDVMPPALDEELVEVPTAVFLDPGRFEYGLADPDGSDLRFVDESGMLLNHEIERWNPDGTSVVWLRLEVVAPGERSRVWLYFGNPGAPTIEEPAVVWSNGYRAVWHMGTPPLLDSTQMSDGCVDAGVIPVEGFLGDALQPQTGGWADCGAGPLDALLTGGGTISVWILPQGPGDAGSGRIVDKGSGTAPGGYNLAMNTEERVHFARGHSDNLGLWRTPTGSVPYGDWVHVAVTYTEGDPTQLPTIYVNGQSQALNPVSEPLGAPDNEQGVPLSLGNHAGTGTRTFEGFIDEVRLSDTIRSEQWLVYSTVSARDQVLAYGQIELLP